jgi:hypothetical protein
MLAFEYNPFKEIIGIDNTKKSIKYTEITQKKYVEGDFSTMLKNAKKAYSYDDNITAVEWLGLAYYCNNFSDSTVYLLQDYEEDFTILGKWLYPTAMINTGNKSKAFELFSQLSVSTVPRNFRNYALMSYIWSASHISCEKLKNFTTEVVNYAEKELEYNSNSGKMVVLGKGSTTLISSDISTIIYLPGIFFIAGLYIYGCPILNQENYTIGDIEIAFYYLEKGFSSGLLSYDIEKYIWLFENLKEQFKDLKPHSYDDFIVSMYIFKLQLEYALNNKIWVGSALLEKKFSSKEQINLRKCIQLINEIQPSYWRDVVETLGKEKVALFLKDKVIISNLNSVKLKTSIE